VQHDIQTDRRERAHYHAAFAGGHAPSGSETAVAHKTGLRRRRERVMMVLCGAAASGGPHEERLIDDIIRNRNYNALARPVAEESEAVFVSFGLSLQQIIRVVSHSVVSISAFHSTCFTYNINTTKLTFDAVNMTSSCSYTDLQVLQLGRICRHTDHTLVTAIFTRLPVLVFIHIYLVIYSSATYQNEYIKTKKNREAIYKKMTDDCVVVHRLLRMPRNTRSRRHRERCNSTAIKYRRLEQ